MLNLYALTIIARANLSEARSKLAELMHVMPITRKIFVIPYVNRLVAIRRNYPLHFLNDQDEHLTCQGLFNGVTLLS